jgi:DNA polymerase-3 subunit delta'
MILDKPKDKTTIPVDNVRDALHFLSKTPSVANGKVLIIKNADALNNNGANALLKKLEEPPKNTLILLTAKTIGGLPITVRSRCWRLRFMGIDKATFLSCLNNANDTHYELHMGNLETAIETQPNNLLLKINDTYKEIIGIAKHQSTSSIIEKIYNLDSLIDWHRDIQLLHLDSVAVTIAT